MNIQMGEKLKKLRIENNLTQKQIAERVGVAISAISAYESDVRCPSYASLLKLATIYHVSCDYLIGMTNTRTLDVTGLTEEQVTLLSNLIEMLKKENS